MTQDPQAAAGQATPPPPGYGPPPAAGFSTRYGLVRPRNGRYLAGVCAAIGRATNTDPVLWRVLLAVLAFFFGIGLLVYIAAWLLIPAEGDSASPAESLLGRGRSSMSPVTVIVLAVAAVVLFGFVVTDTFRAVLLGAAILIGGALLLNRSNNAVSATAPPAAPAGTDVAPPPPPAPTTDTPVARDADTVEGAAAAPPVAADPSPSYPPAPGPYYPAPPPPAAPAYRPPFAPYGPYGGGYPPGPPVPPAPPQPARPPKPPRERSALGAATFSLIPVAIAVVLLLDLLNVVSVHPSSYFAASLATIGLGLLVGAWLGRARWLIALGLVAAAALGISTVAESQLGPETSRRRADVVWTPVNAAALNSNYDLPFGDGTLDLSGVDFAGQDKTVTITMNVGELRVLVPPKVDVTARVDVDAGDARVFGTSSSGFAQPAVNVTDLGDDGAGGGSLKLDVHVNAGDVEVTR
ncbi:MAG TPA: PspC domain-containing protein [Asanoa sp.]